MKNGAGKKELRARLLSRRNKLSEEARRAHSRLIGCSLRKLPVYRGARTVMFYVTHGSEVRTDEMIRRALKEGKTVVVPAVDTAADTLWAGPIASLGEVKKGTFGVREPQCGKDRCVKPAAIDLVLVPGTAFDRSGHRLGYGKGYYDRWLKQIHRDKRVGLAFRFQVVERLPRHDHDEPVSIIVTEKSSIHTSHDTHVKNERSQ